MVEPDEHQAWIIVAATNGVGAETMAVLLSRFGCARDVLRAARSGALRRWARTRAPDTGRRWLAQPVVEGLEGWPEDGRRLLEQLAALGLWTVTPLDADYPAGLRDLDPPPPVLFGSGARELLRYQPSVAVVGTRRPTPHGRSLAARVCSRLAARQALVVSGLAIGIDGVAHSATVEAGGKTIGVIGGGHLNPGPRAHEALRRQLNEAGGAILSEHRPESTPTRGTYPRRNRIIAALADAAVVIEAPARSGALITAREALELGRPVYVTPGRIGDWATAGSLELLHDSPATVVASLAGFEQDLLWLPARSDGGTKTAAVGSGNEMGLAALAGLSDVQRAVAEAIWRSPSGLDRLVEKTGLPPATVSGTVSLLMTRGWIQAVGSAYLPAGPLLHAPPPGPIVAGPASPASATAGTSVP